MDNYQPQSLLLQLPKELRLMIYDYALPSGRLARIEVGNRNYNEKDLAEWPQQPGICRACRLLRSETLEMYYSRCSIGLNIQQPDGMAMALRWLDCLSAETLNKIRSAYATAGLGSVEPSKSYKVDLQRPALISATRPHAAAYLYRQQKHRLRMSDWSPLATDELKARLVEMPGSGSPEFSVAATLRAVVEVVKEFRPESDAPQDVVQSRRTGLS